MSEQLCSNMSVAPSSRSVHAEGDDGLVAAVESVQSSPGEEQGFPEQQ